MVTRRTAIKWLHWLSSALILYFFLVEPEEVERLGGAALATHAGMGVILGLVVALWFGSYLQKGPLGRPGPKLPALGKKAHLWGHRALYWGLPIMVGTGAASGFAAPYVIRAFGLFPINPGFGGRTIHGFLEEIHEITFHALIVLILGHALFHIARHVFLKDNALRIMVPKALHRYL